MKRIMIAAAFVCVATITQAAQYTWSTGKSAYIYAMNGTDKVASTAVYLFNATSAEAVYSAWNGGKGSISGYLDNTATTTAGGITSKATPVTVDAAALNAIVVTEYTAGGTKYLYISGAASKGSVSPGAANVSFTTAALASSKNAATAWKSDGYAGAGWYSAAGNVPEPTSGLLLLLGMAGLALRRRRA